MGHYMLGTFPPSIVLLCRGIGCVIKADDLSPTQLAESERIATIAHRRNRWRLPPSPFELAGAESVDLEPMPRGFDMLPPFSTEVAFFPFARTPQDQGLWAAYALAASLLLRYGIRPIEVQRWALAAHLLAPAWALAALTGSHPHAPSWLVRLRARTVPGRVA